MMDNKTNIRDNRIEMLRIIACILVVTLHTWWPLVNQLKGVNGYVHTVFHGFGNLGVNLFILITAYFGLNLKCKKMFQLIFITSVYSIVAYLLKLLLLDEPFGLKTLVLGMFPIFFNQNWYMCCYCALMLFSPFINKFLALLSKKEMELLISTQLLVFSLIPTLFYYELPGTSAKGICHMVMMYCIGRYLAIYCDIGTDEKLRRRQKKHMILTALFSVGGGIALNSLLRAITGTAKEYFARDCSIFMIVGAMALFCLFICHEKNEKSHRNVYMVSKHCLGIYLIHDALVLKLLNAFVFDFTPYINTNKLVLIVEAEVVVCVVISFFIAVVLDNIFRRLFNFLYASFEKSEIKKWATTNLLSFLH